MYQYRIFRYGTKNHLLPTDIEGWQEAKNQGTPHVVVALDSMEQLFKELFERFQPDTETLATFKSVFLGQHKATNFIVWIIRQPLKINTESVQKLINKIELWALPFEPELKQFFLEQYIKEVKLVATDARFLDLKNLLLARVKAMMPSFDAANKDSGFEDLKRIDPQKWFENRVCLHVDGKIKQMEHREKNIIESRKDILDPNTFNQWLITQRDLYLSEPSLEVFATVYSKSMATPRADALKQQTNECVVLTLRF